MVSAHIAWYLFLAGMGSGAFLVGAVVDLSMRSCRGLFLEDVALVTDRGLVFGPLAVVLGAVFLVADLGMPEKVLQLFCTPPHGILAWGAWSVAAFLICAVGAYIVGVVRDVTGHVHVAGVVEVALQVGASLLAIVVMGYSGLYLSLFPNVPFLNNILVPALFVVSALVAGIGLLFVLNLVSGDGSVEGVGALRMVDRAAVLLEATLLGALLAASWFGDAMSRVSAVSLLFGECSALFWVGVVAVGLIAPLVAGAYHRGSGAVLRSAVGGICSVVGGLCLRYALLLAAVRYSLFDGSAVTFWG